MLIHLVLLRQFRGCLGKCLRGSQSDADRHTYLTLYPLMQVLAPFLKMVKFYAVEIHKALVNAIAEVGGCLLAYDADHSACQLSI